jgi:hypothetical protein
MNKTMKLSLALCALISTCMLTQARIKVNITNLHPEKISNLIPFQYTGPADYYPDEIDQPIIQNASNKLSQLNYEFKLYDYTANKYSLHNTYAGFELSLRFEGLKGIQAKDVSVEHDEDGWFGIITLENSKIHFSINSLSVDFFRDILLNGAQMYSFSEYFMLPETLEGDQWNFKTVDIHDGCVEFIFRAKEDWSVDFYSTTHGKTDPYYGYVEEPSCYRKNGLE